MIENEYSYIIRAATLISHFHRDGLWVPYVFKNMIEDMRLYPELCVKWADKKNIRPVLRTIAHADNPYAVFRAACARGAFDDLA